MSRVTKRAFPKVRKPTKSLLYRQAQVRGLLGGSRPWTILWTLLVARRLFRRLLRDAPEVIYAEELLPGEVLVIGGEDRVPKVLGG